MNYEMELKTKFKFGNDIVNSLSDVLKEYKVKKVLFVYGGGSIKKNGLYDQIIKQLNNAKIKYIEHGGVQPNPRLDNVNQGGLKARKNKCDAILAVGGGSVIDASKAMGALATNKELTDVWNAWIYNKIKNDSLPIFAFITLAATGSENNGNAVITNEKTNQKFSGRHPSCIPVVCFEDPKITLSVDRWNTACGIFDIFTHAFEQYISLKLCDWTRFYLAAQMKTVICNIKKLINNLNNADARANILITSSMALNSIATFNGATGDWVTHQIEHGVSALYDVAHGAGLALILPYYLKYVCPKSKDMSERISQLGQDVFGVKNWKQCIKEIIKWIKFLNLPQKMEQFPQTSKPIEKEKDIIFLTKHYQENLKKSNIEKSGSIFKLDTDMAKIIIRNLFK